MIEVTGRRRNPPVLIFKRKMLDNYETVDYKKQKKNLDLVSADCFPYSGM